MRVPSSKYQTFRKRKTVGFAFFARIPLSYISLDIKALLSEEYGQAQSQWIQEQALIPEPGEFPQSGTDGRADGSVAGY